MKRRLLVLMFPLLAAALASVAHGAEAVSKVELERRFNTCQGHTRPAGGLPYCSEVAFTGHYGDACTSDTEYEPRWRVACEDLAAEARRADEDYDERQLDAVRDTARRLRK